MVQTDQREKPTADGQVLLYRSLEYQTFNEDNLYLGDNRALTQILSWVDIKLHIQLLFTIYRLNCKLDESMRNFIQSSFKHSIEICPSHINVR